MFELNKVVKNISFIFGVIALSLGLSYAVLAWTEPSSVPPGCISGTPGCDVPLNVSSVSQAKGGFLRLGGTTVPTDTLMLGDAGAALGILRTTGAAILNEGNGIGYSAYGLLVPNGNVGIGGTTNPTAKLQISPNMVNNSPRPLYVKNDSTTEAGATTAAFTNNLNIGLAIGAKDGADYGTIESWEFVNGRGSISKNLILNSLSFGRVGVNTISPDAEFHVDMKDLTTTEGLRISRAAAASHYAYLNIVDESLDSVLKVHESGYIGIGTANPSAKLHLVGNSNTSLTSDNIIMETMSDLPDTSANLWGLRARGDTSTGKLSVGAGDELFEIDGVGYVGAGVNKHAAVISIYTDGPYAGGFLPGKIIFNTTSPTGSRDLINPQMILKSDGNVGIGTGSPSAKLSVDGSVSIGSGAANGVGAPGKAVCMVTATRRMGVCSTQPNATGDCTCLPIN